MSSYNDDYNFGVQHEGEIFDTINNYFKRDIKRSDERYSAFDYYDNKYKYELKSRRINSTTFPTTFIQKYKCNNNMILLFNFIDGLYYIKYDANLFNSFVSKVFKRADRIDKIDNDYECYYIPINKLCCICKYENEIDF